MKTKHNFLFIAVLLTALLIYGCAKPPTEEINNAEEAVAVAESNNNAVNYAGHLLEQAKNALFYMREEAAAKNYDLAKKYAAEAVELAGLAIKEGDNAAKDVKLKDEASLVIEGLETNVDETEQIINAARTGGLELDYDSICLEFDAVCQIMGQAQQSFLENKYQDVIVKGKTIRANLDLINQQLSEAATIISRKK
jgi:hypothetical protein